MLTKYELEVIKDIIRSKIEEDELRLIKENDIQS